MSARSRLTRSSRVRLVVRLDDVPVGRVYESANKRLVFVYEDTWRLARGAFPLSVCMPLHGAEYGHEVTRAWLWGLLPENNAMLHSIARAADVSPNDVAGLLAHAGEDCAGAVQLVRPERAGEHAKGADVSDIESNVDWLTSNDIEQELRRLRENPGSAPAGERAGHFSLAGVQPKVAWYRHQDGRMGIPRNGLPTTVILKPPVLRWQDLTWNEHLCLLLARELGCAAASTRVERFGNETAIVVDRYDRVLADNRMRRVHQEDMCQALSVMPTQKYEADGGPGVSDIVRLLSRVSTNPRADAHRLLDAIALNWLLACTDAHAKNFSMLLAGGPQVRLAPLYDVISVLPYPELSSSETALAMHIGGERRVGHIGAQHWRSIAGDFGLQPDEAVEQVRSLAAALPGAFARVSEQCIENDDAMRALERLAAAADVHVARCVSRL